MEQGATTDGWAKDFFAAMLERRLSERDFEAAVEERWRARDFIVRAPETADWLHRLAIGGDWREAGYAHAMPGLGFRSHYLVGVADKPGAVFIEAPPEARRGGGLSALNRPLHQHDSGRISVITSGAAVFHVLAEGTMLDCPVSAGDVVLWPAWTPHTFDAREGFSLVTAMAKYVSPAKDGFVFPVEDHVAALPRQAYGAHCSA